MKVKVQIEIFECTGIMDQDLVHSYIQSNAVLCDNVLARGSDPTAVVVYTAHDETENIFLHDYH